MINQDQAIQIARHRATENHLGPAELIRVKSKRRWTLKRYGYGIEFNHPEDKTISYITIDINTGGVLSEAQIINEAQAIDIARRRAADKQWGFGDPVWIMARQGWNGRIQSYDIESCYGKRGTKARFTMDASTGEVTSEGYIPR